MPRTLGATLCVSGGQIGLVALATTLISLTGCSGSHAVPPGPEPQNTAAGANSARAAATLKIVIPARSTSASHRRAQYVSPATQSIAISFIPAGGGTTIVDNVNLTPASNPNCAANLVSPEVCTITLSLPPGSFTASFTTYDGLLDGNGNPTGNVLSQNQSVPVTITVGGPNALNVALQGVPISVALIPAATATIGGSQAAGLTLSKCFANQSVTVIALDADGNNILGPGAPTPALVSNDTTQLAITAPSASSPNTFTLTRPGIPNGHATITLTASVTSGTSGSPVSAPVAVTFDGTICGVFTAYTIPTGGSFPYSLTSGPDGAVWYADASQAIGRVSTAGVFTNYPVLGDNPYFIAPGPDGALWFTDEGNQHVGRITTSGTITQFPLSNGVARPEGIVTGPDGALWFTEYNGNNIGRIDTSGNITEFAIPTSGSEPAEIAVGPDGALWFTEYQASKIGRIDTSGTITEYTVPTSASYPNGIAAGPDGAIWFAELGAGNIGRLTTAGVFSEYPAASPCDIVLGPDGALWFSQGSAGKIGRITTAGTITEYTVPAPSGVPFEITLGPDGGLWFTDFTLNKIGRLQ